MPQLPHTRLEGSGLPHMGHSRTDWSETDPKEEIFIGALEGGWTTVGGAVGAAEPGVGSTGAALAEAPVVVEGAPPTVGRVGAEAAARAGSAEGVGGVGTEKGSAGGDEGGGTAGTSVTGVGDAELELEGEGEGEDEDVASPAEGPAPPERSFGRLEVISEAGRGEGGVEGAGWILS